MNDTKLEKLLLLGLAGLAIVALTALGFSVIRAGKIDATTGTILGVIVGILGTFSKDIVQAIRGYSMSAQLGKVTDQLAASGPVASEASPQSAIEAANQVANAAADQAAVIKDS